MKLISWNVNGIRAAGRKGFLDWFADQQAEVVSVQEIKARPDQLEAPLRNPHGYHSFWEPAEKPGYSGVALFTKQEPLVVEHGLGVPEIDREGRVLIAVFPQFTLVNAYFPHARRDLTRLDYKMTFCSQFLLALERFKRHGKPLVVCGDYNMSHRDIDLTHAKANRKNAGFLPIEKKWMDDFLHSGFHDVFREHHPGEAGHHTWWSNRKGVRERNVGWRIDYHCVQAPLVDRIVESGHQTEVYGSDHCPVYIKLR